MKAWTKTTEGYAWYLDSVVDTTKKEEAKPKDVLLDWDLMDVSQKINRLTIKSDSLCEIELLPRMTAVSKASYQMTPVETKELQVQL